MHRLIADHIRNRELPETDLVDEFIIQRARKLGSDFTQAPELWEIDSIADALPGILTCKPELLGHIADFVRLVALRYVTDTRITAMLQNLTTHLSGTSTRTSFLAHTLLGDALQNTDPAQARESYQRSLAITRYLAEIWPDDLQPRRDFTVALINVAGMLKHSDPGQALELYEESLGIGRDLAERLSGDFQARRDLTVALINVAGMLKHSDPGQALKLYEESLRISRELAAQLPGNLQALSDRGVSAARLAQLLPTEDPERIPLWREAAISLRDALAIQPENKELGRMSYYVALYYADCDPDDRDEWLAYAAGLAECFGFGKE